MIICEECGAHNRNSAYVCEECGASLLHLEATEDDFEPVKRKSPLFGRKARPVADDPDYEEEEYVQDDSPVYKEEEPEEEPVRVRRPLFGRKARPAADEPDYEEEEYVQDDSPVYEEEEPEEEPVRARRPLFGRKRRTVADEMEYSEDEYVQSEPEVYDGKGPEGKIEFLFEEQQPEEDRPLAAESEPAILEETEEAELKTSPLAAQAAPFVTHQESETIEDEPADASLSFDANERKAEETANSTYNEPNRVSNHIKGAEPEPEEAPSSITIDMEVQEFDDEDDGDDDGSYEEEDSYPAAPVYKTDYKSAYIKSRKSEGERMTRGMIASIITVSSLLVVTLVVLGVLLIGKNSRTASVIATSMPTEAVTAAPTEVPTPSPVAEPTPSPTPVPTTPPEDDFGSVFEQPTSGLLPDANQ